MPASRAKAMRSASLWHHQLVHDQAQQLLSGDYGIAIDARGEIDIGASAIGLNPKNATMATRPAVR
jgi:hypothetical protein